MLAEKFGIPGEASRVTQEEITRTQQLQKDLTNEGLVKLGKAWNILAQAVSQAAKKIVADLAPVSDLIEKLANFVRFMA